MYGVWQCRKIVREEESRGGRAVVVAKRGDGTTARAVSPMGMYIPVIYAHIAIETPYFCSIGCISVERVKGTWSLLYSLYISPLFAHSAFGREHCTLHIAHRRIETSPSFPYSVENYVLLRLINKPRKRTRVHNTPCRIVSLLSGAVASTCVLPVFSTLYSVHLIDSLSGRLYCEVLCTSTWDLP